MPQKKMDFTGDNERKIVIPGELPGLNKIIDKSKTHWAAYSEMKKEHTNTIAWIAKTELEPMSRIELDITYYCKNRMKDPDNIAAGKKFIIDGLVEAEILENDGWKQIEGWNESFAVDKENPRVEVIIKEVK